MISVLYTLVGKPFADWAFQRMEWRNEKVVEKQQLAIEMDPDILRAFHASTFVSSKYRSLLTSMANFIPELTNFFVHLA